LSIPARYPPAASPSRAAPTPSTNSARSPSTDRLRKYRTTHSKSPSPPAAAPPSKSQPTATQTHPPSPSHGEG